MPVSVDVADRDTLVRPIGIDGGIVDARLEGSIAIAHVDVDAVVLSQGDDIELAVTVNVLHSDAGRERGEIAAVGRVVDRAGRKVAISSAEVNVQLHAAGAVAARSPHRNIEDFVPVEISYGNCLWKEASRCNGGVDGSLESSVAIAHGHVQVAAGS